MTITFPELAETEAKLNDKRKQLKAVFDEAGPELDMGKVKSLDGDSTAKVEAIRALNDEIDDLARKAERQRDLKRIAEAAANSNDERTETGADTKGAKSDESPFGVKDLADRIIKSGMLEAKAGHMEVADFDVKTLFETAAGWAPYEERRARVVDYATRPVELLDVIPTTTTGATGSLSYFEETTFTNAAAETAEGGAKPEAALALTERTAAIRKIAVLLPVTDEQLEDEPRVRGYIENRLPFMVRQRLSGQIIAGNGTAPNLRGVLNVVGIQTQAKGADPTPDAVYKAITKVRVTGQAEPNAAVFHPNDWQDIRLLRTTDGIYIWGNPSEAGPERIWGLTVVQAQAETENTGLVGDFANYSELAVRSGLSVELGYNADDFSKNRKTFRAEMRAAFIVYRPAAFCTITGI